jgi:Lar family restriction alleviation protein
MRKLKPCPFCGGKAKTEPCWENDEWFVVCRDCNGSASGWKKSKAIEKWNTRVIAKAGGGDEVCKTR